MSARNQRSLSLVLYGRPGGDAISIAAASGMARAHEEPTGDDIREAMEWLCEVHGELAALAGKADADAAKGGGV